MSSKSPRNSTAGGSVPESLNSTSGQERPTTENGRQSVFWSAQTVNPESFLREWIPFHWLVRHPQYKSYSKPPAHAISRQPKGRIQFPKTAKLHRCENESPWSRGGRTPRGGHEIRSPHWYRGSQWESCRTHFGQAVGTRHWHYAVAFRYLQQSVGADSLSSPASRPHEGIDDPCPKVPVL
jgi:hypothetical protein